MEKKNKSKTIIIFIIFIVLITLLTIFLWKYVDILSNEEYRKKFQEYLNSLGVVGWFIIIIIQLIQMIIAFLPGEIVELLMGAIYGPWLGLLSCLIGVFIGSAIIFFLSKKIGLPFVKLFVSEKDFKKYKFLNNQTKLETTIFILFFIPGTPKDALTYIVPFTKISFWRFLLISTIARIPSIITSTFIGSQIINGEYDSALITFIITAIISIIGIIFNNIYLKKKQESDHSNS